MKYKTSNNKNSLEIMKEEKTNKTIDDFDKKEYLDEEFVTETKEEKKEEKPVKKTKTKKESKSKKKTTKKEEPVLTIEPIRKVTKEEYKDIAKKREEEKERQLKLEQEKYEKKKNHKKLSIKTILNIIFIVVLVLIIMTVIDVISVSKYEKGPFFALNTNTYKDGGTRIYTGIGYKVIKYHQLQGRRDMEIGSWALKYNAEPVTTSDIDLAIEFNNDELTTFDNYYKKFVRISSTLRKVNKKNNSILIGYEDEDGKYTMDIICKMADKENNLESLEVGKEITIIGTIKEFSGKTSTTPTTIKIKDCFAEQ